MADLHLTIPAPPNEAPLRGHAVSKFTRMPLSAASSAPGILMHGAQASDNTLGNSGFGELLTDIINPLQHVPILGHIYRAISGDEIAPAAQVAGGTLFGGPIGGLISLASAVFGEIFNSEADATKLAARETAETTKILNS